MTCWILTEDKGEGVMENKEGFYKAAFDEAFGAQEIEEEETHE
jgi:hypothetical protein